MNEAPPSHLRHSLAPLTHHRPPDHLRAARWLSRRPAAARPERDADRTRRVTAALRDLLTVPNSGQTIDEVLARLVEHARALLASDAVALFQVHEESGTLRICAVDGMHKPAPEATALPIGRGWVGRAIETGTAVAVEDIRTRLTERGSDRLTRNYELYLHDYWSALSVPLITSGRVWGGLSFYYIEPRHFAAEDLRLAAAVADQAALALHIAQLRTQAQAMAAAAERHRIARELHDALSQTLFSANLIAGVLPQLWEQAPAAAQSQTQELSTLTRKALAEMRTLLMELRPTALTDAPFETLLRQLAAAQSDRVAISVAAHGNPGGPLPPEVQLNLYRIAQEAISNIVRHAQATAAAIELRLGPDGGSLVISDDGAGFSADAVAPHHFGLTLMRERAESVGATFDVASAPGAGTRIAMRWGALQAEP